MNKQIEEMAKIANFTAFDYRNGEIKSKTIYTAIAEAILPLIKQYQEQAVKEFAEIATEKIAKMQGERDCYEANSIDNKAKYDGDIVDLALHETLKEVIGYKE